MEVHSDLVRSTGGNVVLYGEDPRALVQLERAAVQDWVRQSCITVVLADHLAPLGPRLLGNAACTRSWTPQKRAKHDRLIEPVHHKRVMRPRASEMRAPGREAEVVVRARVDED